MHAHAKIWHSSLFVFSAHHFQRSQSSRCIHLANCTLRSPFLSWHLPISLHFSATSRRRALDRTHSLSLSERECICASSGRSDTPLPESCCPFSFSRICVPGQSDISTETWEKDGNNATRSPARKITIAHFPSFSCSDLPVTLLFCAPLAMRSRSKQLGCTHLASPPRCERLFVR